MKEQECKHRFKTVIDVVDGKPIYTNICRSCRLEFKTDFYTKDPKYATRVKEIIRILE